MEDLLFLNHFCMKCSNFIFPFFWHVFWKVGFNWWRISTIRIIFLLIKPQWEAPVKYYLKYKCTQDWRNVKYYPFLVVKLNFLDRLKVWNVMCMKIMMMQGWQWWRLNKLILTYQGFPIKSDEHPIAKRTLVRYST